MATQLVEDEDAPAPVASNAVLVVKPGPGQSNLPLIEGTARAQTAQRRGGVSLGSCSHSARGSNVVGRQPVLGQKERALIIADPTVSARHAIIGSSRRLLAHTTAYSRARCARGEAGERECARCELSQSDLAARRHAVAPRRRRRAHHRHSRQLYALPATERSSLRRNSSRSIIAHPVTRLPLRRRRVSGAVEWCACRRPPWFTQVLM